MCHGACVQHNGVDERGTILRSSVRKGDNTSQAVVKDMRPIPTPCPPFQALLGSNNSLKLALILNTHTSKGSIELLDCYYNSIKRVTHEEWLLTSWA